MSVKWQLEIGQCRKMLQGWPVSPSSWDLGAEPGLAQQPQPASYARREWDLWALCSIPMAKVRAGIAQVAFRV